ncbi:Uncharacterised protein [Salmonella enterica subsp. enterica]|uniref:Uncharacterized protein n=1 Tax=Salmonella enterica I TaxID=59201 RepID=A0A379UQA3_SALET|nr:Uncharacterised protein [Salmonella enterica subsp. enterica]
MTTLKQDLQALLGQEVTLKGVVTQTRAKKPRDAGFLSDGNLSLRLSYHVFNAFKLRSLRDDPEPGNRSGQREVSRCHRCCR